MKTKLVVLIAGVAVTNIAHAKTWAWFRGDIGVASSPFVTASSQASGTTTLPATNKKTIQKNAVAQRTSKPTSHRITER